ncbi:MAG TPA: SRPBCC domain-containing protein [Gemmatimonadales bacterium]|nr:SRPBCC domain-containing protein [Gemmatimonadales bacterium]
MPRALHQAIAIHAPAALVWKAIAEAEGIRNWFSFDARVEPGVGGKIWWSFGPGMEWDTPITIWEPEQHLQTASDMGPDLPPFAVDYFIEGQGDTTVLRLVTSGFGDDKDSDEMYYGMEAGWAYFLQHIKLLLERHWGVDREIAWERRRVAGTRAEGWARIAQALGLTPGSRAGDTIRFELAGTPVAGRIVTLTPGRTIGAVLPALNDAIFLLEQEAGDPKWTLGGYLSMYGVDAETVRTHQQYFTRTLDTLAGPKVE